ncbi:MAG: hypothetical protein GX610_02340 [Rhodococcus sp.]|nr:hypothetical protein [Rhodococcus sp. (in: high G+C Gram-positive bacteria)]
MTRSTLILGVALTSLIATVAMLTSPTAHAQPPNTTPGTDIYVTPSPLPPSGCAQLPEP